jgi:hypothetical protein
MLVRVLHMLVLAPHMLVLALQSHQGQELALQNHQGQELALQRAPHPTKERGHQIGCPKKGHQSHRGPEQATRNRILLVQLLLLALAPRTSHHLRLEQLEQEVHHQTPQKPVLEQAHQSHQILQKLAQVQESSHQS